MDLLPRNEIGKRVLSGHDLGPRRWDAAIARRATSQHGLITAAQLSALGMSRSCISKRAGRGLLHRVHRGVYSVGYATPSFEAAAMAAVLAAGRHACVTGLTAAELYRVSRFPHSCVDVVSPRSCAIPGIRCRRSRLLEPGHVWHRRGIPTASPSRMLVDLAVDLTAHQLAYVMHQLAYRRLLHHRRLEGLARRCSSFHGHDTLLAAMDLHSFGSSGTRSSLEDRFLSLLDALGAAPPLVNTVVTLRGEPHELDLFWPAHGLAVEVDGIGHLRPACRRADGVRDALAAAEGLTLLRVREETMEQDASRIARFIGRDTSW